MTVYVSIGNSDDKLSQNRWAEFIDDLVGWIDWAISDGGQIHGVWFSPPDARWQNMCMAFDVPDEYRDRLRAELAKLAGRYEQESIAWAEAKTEFLGGTT